MINTALAHAAFAGAQALAQSLASVQGTSSTTADFSTHIVRIRALGFNAVKLPFSFSQLLGTALAPVSTACTTATDAQLQVGT